MTKLNQSVIELFNNTNPDDQDYQKMLGYIRKGSNPNKVANSIKNLKKFIRRYKIAIQANVYDYDNAFRLILPGSNVWELNDRFRINESFEFYYTLAQCFEDYKETLPQQYQLIIQQNTIDVPEVQQSDNQRNLLNVAPLLYKYLIKQDKPFSLKIRKPTNQELQFFKNNGRIWPMAYTLWVNDNRGMIKKFEFCYYSSEGETRSNKYTTPLNNRGDWVINQHELLETLQRIIQ